MYYNIQFPVFSFDINEKNLIAVIYQNYAKNELSFRDINLNEELFFFPLESSLLNVKIRFLKDTEKAVCFDGNQIIVIDLIEKSTSVIQKDIDDCTIIKDIIIAVSVKGEVFMINSKEEIVILGSITDYVSTKEMYLTQLIDFSYKEGNVIITYNNTFHYVNLKNKNYHLTHLHSENTDKIKYITISNSLNFAGCIVENNNKLISLSKNENESNLTINPFLDIQNCACIKIIENTNWIIIASNIGYISIVNLKSSKLIYSERKHSLTIRDLKVDNEFIYTSGDDGIIVKTLMPSLQET